MARSADYTIKGFLYQFNKTAVEVLNAEDAATVVVEGVIEDVEVITPISTKGIQCKYHEASSGFTPSAIYKPLLQMLGHYSSHSTDAIEYVLFAYFPDAKGVALPVGKETCKAALASKDESLKKLIDAIPSTIDIDSFVTKFRMEFGPSYNELVDQVTQSLEKNGFPSGEIETLAYPNVIHLIAGISILHDPAKRQITRKQFIDKLNDIRTTAISRWTMALHSRKKLLEARRKQLKANLDKNSRLRYFIVDPESFSGYESEIVLFISDYIDKYHFKQAHINTPLLCIFDTRSGVQEIQHRLYKKDIITTDGHVGVHFEELRFFRPPLSVKGTGSTVQREFDLRITNWEDHSIVLNNRKCDDLFILGVPDCASLDTVDVNVEHLSGITFKEIKFVMGISNAYE